MDCKNYYRTIALIPHASKIVLGIIHQRMLSYYEQEPSETQAGFRKDNGTRDQIMNLIEADLWETEWTQQERVLLLHRLQ